jgi:DNA polymerase III gamma/tau subunit
MPDFESATTSCPGFGLCLDARRPRSLAQVVGQEHIIPRLRQSLQNDRLPQLIALLGPSGVGKTTLATILARITFCPQARELGDCCGKCTTCRRDDLNGYEPYHEWAGADLDEAWHWWLSDSSSVLGRPSWFFFLDEVQDLSKLHQKALLKKVESAQARIILATTHRHEIVDALLNRFGTNVFELRRPTLAQVVTYMVGLCRQKGLQASEGQLARVAGHFSQDLRKCVDFVYSAEAQTSNGIVTDEFVGAVLGVTMTNRPGPGSVATCVEL